MDEQAQQFLNELKAANAEDLKKRVLKAVTGVLENSGLSKEELRDITIDVSDYLK